MNQKTVKPTGVITFTNETQTLSGPIWDSTKDDVSPVYITERSKLVINNPYVTSSGDSSSEHSSSFSGLNAALVVDGGSEVAIEQGTIKTSGKGANGVFSTGLETKVTMSDVAIETSGEGAHGIMATGGGSLRVKNLQIQTQASRAAAIATDRSGGSISFIGGTALTAGENSPGIYSTGTVTVSSSTITGNEAEAAVVEGKNSITLKDSNLSAGQKCGVMLYQSFSGDADDGSGSFTMSGGSFDAAIGPLVYVNNTQAVVSLTGVKVTAHSGILLDASSSHWGQEGSNGGHVVLSVSGQTLQGDVLVDAISSATVNLRNTSTLTGAIHGAAINLDSTSKWNVAGDSVITSISETDSESGNGFSNIIGNGHNVEYDATLPTNTWMGGKTYQLPQGGLLLPQNSTNRE